MLLSFKHKVAGAKEASFCHSYQCFWASNTKGQRLKQVAMRQYICSCTREQSNTTCIVQNITDIDREIAEQKSQVWGGERAGKARAVGWGAQARGSSLAANATGTH
jgi:hypothetical protein